MNDNELRVTGLMFYYYWVCDRKLWYFYNNICMEQNNENVALGKLLDEKTYSKEKKHINIDNVINIDFIEKDNILHEIKKSKKIEEASIWQLKYYLYYLKQKGVYGLVGRIDYPLLKQTKEVKLLDSDEVIIEKVLDNIKKIILEEKPRSLYKKAICKNCSYYDLCYI
ncbi:CRISPR-associated protein Cas4 [Lachnobacterium bovis]|uniref:CRISPR-associated exonuclease Cas4 n=1 Tax=Lachnobacterium bovis TaxID=140626 RepID=A0A1H9S5M8_9FIRM|nr:CRISPR-associated protein Cas4 [Lachnobacterium bovis]SER80297.1 CRISPR-associated exonuclease Cas4 [Lachnobacterium bovis]